METKKTEPVKVRGTATFYTSGDMDFKAQGTGQPMQEVLKKAGESKFYRTTSKDKPKVCAKLMFDADIPDIAYQMEEQLSDFLKGFGATKRVKEMPTQKDRPLWLDKSNDNDVCIWYDAKDKAVKVNLSLPVVDGKNYGQETQNLIAKVYQCFTINKQFLVQRGRALRKTSKG